eukprot:6206219-Pleurochrysis_carterae.AAC.1
MSDDSRISMEVTSIYVYFMSLCNAHKLLCLGGLYALYQCGFRLSSLLSTMTVQKQCIKYFRNESVHSSLYGTLAIDDTGHCMT